MERAKEVKLPNPKRYPKFLNIKDERYQVLIVKHIPKESKTLNGLCDGDVKKIWIRKGQSPFGLFRTYIHEVLHALEFEYHIRIRHETIYELEVAIAALMQDNF